MSSFTKRLSRRSLLVGAGGAALLASSATLSGCGGGSTTTNNTAANNGSVQLPSYIEYSGLKPDLPGTEQGVDPGFYRFPAENPKSVLEKPGTGNESITGMANIYYAVPPGPDRNSYWAGLNERLGVDLKLQMVGTSDYNRKFATTIAGSDLPDVMQMELVANFPALLDKRFTPLDEYLAGDAIKDYPNLANLPNFTWNSAIQNGKIYGVPIPRGKIGNYNFIRQDLFEAKGLSTAPKSFDEFIETMKALTDPRERRWACGLIKQPRDFLGKMNGEPNTWRYEEDKLTHRYETGEYKQTVTDLVAIWESGVIHPDAFNTSQPAKQLFNAGTCAMNLGDGYVSWTQYVRDNESNPEFKLGLMPTYNRDGSQLANWWYGDGVYSITALKKQDNADKVKLVLRVLNWLAAPFGTEEYLYRLYGEEGVDHKKSAQGDPVLTPTGATNTVLPVRFLADSPYTLYQPGRPQDADTQHEYQSLEIPTGIANPTAGLFSNASATRYATIDKNFNDGINQIIQGRYPISELDNLLSAWKSGGGDEMRREYEDQLQKNGGPR